MTTITETLYPVGLLLICLSISISGTAQKTAFIEPEIMIGKNVANYKTFPQSSLRTTYVLNIGTFKNDPEKHEHRYYNFPHTGISLAYSDLGNHEVLGKELSIIPYITLNSSKRLRHSWSFKFGLGGSYITRYYHPKKNPGNKVVGSGLNWTFQAYLYHTLWMSSRYSFKVGGGYLHSSNAHTQLPNFGLNSAMLSISCNYYFRDIDTDLKKVKMEKLPSKRFLQFRYGTGMHELGSTTGPVGGPKKPVYSFAGAYGILLNQQLKIYSGFFYRFYDAYYQYLRESSGQRTAGHKWEASNISFYIGVEYLIGHVGMNIEGGLNLYKPFYDDFYALYETGNRFNEFRMSMFNTRMGLNLYLFNTNKQPKHNVALAGHVNANFGKADFGELSLTYIKMLK